MSRSGYVDEEDEPGQFAMWKGAVQSAMRGKRGQQLLRDLAEAMDAMPEKALIAHELVEDGAHCALGVVGAKRGIDLTALDPEEFESVAPVFNIAEAMAREVTYVNDECGPYGETPEARWIRVRKWVAENVATDGRDAQK